MAKYYVSEAEWEWEPTMATTVAGAKRAAEGRRMFQGSDLHVGREVDGVIRIVATMFADPLDVTWRRRWIEPLQAG